MNRLAQLIQLDLPTPAPRWWVRFGAIVPIFAGILVLFGWQIGNPYLKSMVPDLGAVNPATAVLFLFVGGAILGISSDSPQHQKWGHILAGGILFAGVLRLGTVLQFWNVPLDQLLFFDRLNDPVTGHTSRMTATTAFDFVLVGGALLCRRARASWGVWLAQFYLAAIALLSLIAVAGYLYGARTFLDFGNYVPMPLPTALTFLVVITGIYCLDPECGVMNVVTARGPAGLMTRRLLFGSLCAPLILGRTLTDAQNAELFKPVVSVALFSVLAVIFSVIFVLWNGVQLKRMEDERIGYLRDIRESEERFRLLAESAFEAIVISVGGVVYDANQQFCRMFGVSLDDVIGRRAADFVKTEAREAVMERVAKHREDIYETVGLKSDGTEFDIEICARSVPFGEIRARVAAIRDISERKRIESLKDEFVSVVSHELRTPLTAIHGSLGLLRGGVAGLLPEKADQMLEIAARNSQRLLLLINDILDMQKIESGQMKFVHQPFDVGALLQNAIEHNASFAQTYDVRLEIAQNALDTRILGDTNRLGQVLTNLISNAVKFSPPGGVVQLAACLEGETVRVEVRDTGPGIPSSFHGQIFQKFAQADASPTRRQGGTGLGLSICKAIIDQLGGTIGFETQSGKGTTFYFELPANVKSEE